MYIQALLKNWKLPSATSCATSTQPVRDRSDRHLEVEGVVGVRHQAVLVGALQLEAMCDHAVRSAVLAVAVEFGQTVAVSELLEVLVGAVHAAGAEVLHNACTEQREGEKSSSSESRRKSTCA